MSYYDLGTQLKQNMMNGMPTRTKSSSDYTAYAIPPCGTFAKSLHRSAIESHWLQGSVGGQSHISIDKEIALFLNYLEPTPREVARRKDLVQRFKALITSFGMNISIQPVGSYVTGLYLPSSDIDMVLTFQKSYGIIPKNELYRILLRIRQSGFAGKVEDVLKATVPLIRITDKVTGIEIDLTASDIHSVNATKAVQKWMQGETEIKKMLITVVKMFLSIRKCGTTYTGGINSYVLVWMVVAWVTLEWPKIKGTGYSQSTADISVLTSAFGGLTVHSSAGIARSLQASASTAATVQVRQPRYGRALREFFKFYGYNFDCFSQAIRIEPRPSYTVKVYPYSRYPITQRYLLSIFDPADSSVDMGSKAYGIKHIQVSFREAYTILATARSKTRAERLVAHPKGILAKLLDGDFTEFEQAKKKAAGRV